MSSSSGEDSVAFESASDDSGSDNSGSEARVAADSPSRRGGDFVSLLDKASAQVRSKIQARAARSNSKKRPLEASSSSSLSASSSAASATTGKGGIVNKSSVVYLGHVPHGFYEDQMRSFFTQFGAVRRLRLSRNKKTGRSKHYAFVEFEERAVAKIVAATMDGYFLAGRKMVAHVVKKANVHPRMFDGANRKFRPIPWRLIAKQRHNAPRSDEQQAKRVARLTAKEKKKRAKLKALGVDYEFRGYAGAEVADEAAGESGAVEVSPPARKKQKSSASSRKKKKRT